MLYNHYFAVYLRKYKKFREMCFSSKCVLITNSFTIHTSKTHEELIIAQTHKKNINLKNAIVSCHLTKPFIVFFLPVKYIVVSKTSAALTLASQLCAFFPQQELANFLNLIHHWID